MPTAQRTPVRAALSLALAVVLMVVVPYAHAESTASVNADLVWRFQTLNGTTLDVATVMGTATSLVNVVLQGCTINGGGFFVNGTSEAAAPSSSYIWLDVRDTNVRDATVAFRNHLPGNSSVRIVNVTAAMQGSTPLFDMQNFYLKAGSGSSMMIQRVRATWDTGDGGSVVKLGGSDSFGTVSGRRFYFSESVVTGAAHMLEITSRCTADYCFGTSDGLNAFDMITFNDARGAFLYSAATTTGATLACTNHGMIRFNNITMTGGEPFFEVANGNGPAINNTYQGNVLISAIWNDGPLFQLVPGADVVADAANVKYTFRHINVPSVMSAATSYTTDVPVGKAKDSDKTWYFVMGNITVGATLLDTINDLKQHQLYASQMVDAYGKVQEVGTGGNWPTARIGSWYAPCVIEYVLSVYGGTLPGNRKRATCFCTIGKSSPYCTTPEDPLVVPDAWPPDTCDVAKCDSCLFHHSSQCGGCSTGYSLKSDLSCDIRTCGMPHCTSCAISSGAVCTECETFYSLSDDQTTCIPCGISHCKRCTTDNVCDSCMDGYSLSDLKTTCFSCDIANCAYCIADGVCDSCTKGYKLKGNIECQKSGVGWWVWLIVALAVAAVVAGVIVLVVCCLRHRRHRGAEGAAELNEYDANMGAGNMGRTAWGVPIAMDTAVPDQSPPTAAQRAHSDDCQRVRTAWVSPTVVHNPLDQFTPVTSQHTRSDDCHAVHAGEESESVVANPVDEDSCYPFEEQNEEARWPSRSSTEDAGSRVEHSFPPTTMRHYNGTASSHDAT